MSSSDARTPAQDSLTTKGELSYHYWHGRNAGEAPAAQAKVRAATRRARAFVSTDAFVARA